MIKKMKECNKIMLLIFFTFVFAFILYYKHWTFELPLHPNIDEKTTINAVRSMLSSDSYTYSAFNYPHLTFYYGMFWYKLVSAFCTISDLTLFLRAVICGFALISNICIYFAVKRLTGSRKWGYIGLLISIFSLYQMEYLYYSGPDTMLYGCANVVILLGIIIFKEEDSKKSLYKWYPLIAIWIGLATAAKYHGILLGMYWLVIHVVKKNHKQLKANLSFILSCFLIVIAYLVCNISDLLYLKKFISEFFRNFSHYSGGHIGLEHNFPLIGYLEPFFLYGFGVIGAFLMVLGLVELLKKKENRTIGVVLLVMPVLVFIVLCRYKVVLGRNICLIMPYTYLFLLYGLIALENIIKISQKKIIVNAVVFVMLLANVFAICVSENYDSSYQYAEEYIADNIPSGSVIYVYGFYVPNIDEEKYTLVTDQIPDHLEENEYYIDVEYQYDRYIQRKDYLLFKGEYMYPELAERYYAQNENFQELVSFRGITMRTGWRYRIGYFDCFKYKKGDYFIGPTIKIYK
ncbi:MAG: glycosyltransferase family 39 protein [Eubacterium sp.]|nr:glycosyltransferase family 39 protein [Eubacterium sp.]